MFKDGDIKYTLIFKDEIRLIDWSEVNQEGPEDLVYSSDGKATFVTYKGEQPFFIFRATSNYAGRDEYTHEQFSKFLKTDGWQPQS